MPEGEISQRTATAAPSETATPREDYPGFGDLDLSAANRAPAAAPSGMDDRVTSLRMLEAALAAAQGERDGLLEDVAAAQGERDAALADRDAAIQARDAALADRDGEIQARDAALAEIQDLRGHLDDANEDRDFFERKYDKYKAEVFRTQS
ncbi:hypothetical protein SO694_0037501 [Aureococcus anophagefferens]|uniref:Expressed protein n=2 Tax=Aureococcus anophagefferens TaxID=44056 RepID=F0YN36_AURAN|nr:expressed protein [Aureococcus anophagefferens]EGB03486.1 expressed protein [Aureococcus anophagefferens]|eukprot:XP_009041815.1 expressed protein [Aureococcus anophagefferens]